MDAFRDVMKVAFPEVRTLVGITGGKGFTLNASDRLWKMQALRFAASSDGPLSCIAAHQRAAGVQGHTTSSSPIDQ